jgi:hypothetical protein
MGLARIACTAALALCVAAAARATCPATNCDPDASLYLVRQSCGELANCFESVTALSGKSGTCLGLTLDEGLALGQLVVNGLTCTTNGWLWSVRAPSDDERVTIDVGPGVFQPFVCPNGSPRHGHVTLRGAGPEQTKLLDGSSFGIGMDIFGCEAMIVSQLTAEGNFYGVRWIGGGEGTWSYVDMIADRRHAGGGGLTAGWVDGCAAYINGDAGPSRHHIYDSRSIATGPSVVTSLSYAYTANCSETWFFGGEIINTMSGPTNIHAGLGVGTRPNYLGSARNRFYLFETQIVTQPQNMYGNVAVGLDVQNGGLAHIQDGGITVEVGVAPGRSANAIGVRTQNGGKAERIATPIEASTASGSALDELLN